MHHSPKGCALPQRVGGHVGEGVIFGGVSCWDVAVVSCKEASVRQHSPGVGVHLHTSPVSPRELALADSRA
eukprot:3226268-Rhodomonas_salina.1